MATLGAYCIERLFIKLKQILIIIGGIVIFFGGIYYFISPYQKCLRIVNRKIEVVRNKLATETDLSIRVKLESKQKRLFNQIKFCGVVMTDQSKDRIKKSYVCDENGINCQYVDINNLDNKPIYSQ